MTSKKYSAADEDYNNFNVMASAKEEVLPHVYHNYNDVILNSNTGSDENISKQNVVTSFREDIMVTDENHNDTDKMSNITAISSTILQEKAPTLRENVSIVIMLIGYILVNLLGGLLFKLIEQTPYEGKPHWLSDVRKQFLQNHSCIDEIQLDKFLIVSRDIYLIFSMLLYVFQ